MTLSITHPFVSGYADGNDASKLRPSDWNATHGISGILPTTNGGTGQSSLGWLDVRNYGAIGDGVHNDTTEIQAAITAAAAAGGGIVMFPPGVYVISAALVVPSGVSLVGAGYVSQILHNDNTKDVVQIGATGSETGDNVRVTDLRLTNGRYGLNLNNALYGRFERLTIESNNTCIYLQGQNEAHGFRDLVLNGNGTTLHGIWAGNTNGGTGSVLDLPVLQKSSFERLRIAQMAETAILISAGVLSVQQSSGSNRFRDLLFEGNKKGDIDITYSFHTAIDGMSNEDTPAANNTYAAVSVTSSSTVFLRNAYLSGGSPNHFKYLAYVHGATLLVSDCVLSGSSTADIRNDGGGTALTVMNTFVDTAGDLSFADATCRALSNVVGLRDGSGNLLETDIGVLATGSLPSNAADAQNGQIVIENAGAGDQNLIIFAGGQRFRIDGGAAF